MLKSKKKKAKNKDGEMEDEEDEVMMAQLAAKGAGTLQYTKPAAEPLLEIEAKPDPKESEEWQKFNALLNKTQETVAATQTKMSKLADTSVTSSSSKTTSSTGPAPSWTNFEAEAERKPPEEETTTTETATAVVEDTAPAVEAVVPPSEPPTPVLEPIRVARTPSPPPLPPQPAIVPTAVQQPPASNTPERSRTPVDSIAAETMTRAQTPPPAIIARPRPKGGEISLTTPVAPPAPPAPTTSTTAPPPATTTTTTTTIPSPPSSSFNVPDVFDTSKFLEGGASEVSDNPFKAMLDEKVDVGAEDFFAKAATKSAPSSEAWGNETFLPVPKIFDVLQTYSDDEGAAAAATGAEGGEFSSANNPFRAASPPAGGAVDAFGASDDLFAQLANIGNKTSDATSGGGGAEWDEFDPFCEHPKKQSSDQTSAFPVNFDEKSRAASAKRRQLKERKEGSEGSQGSTASGASAEDYDYDENEVLEPLAPFHEAYRDQWWQMGLRHPPKKSKMPFTGQRGWKTTYGRMETDPKNSNVFVRLYVNEKDAIAGKSPLQELKLDPYMTLSEIGMQPFDEYGKVYTTKIFRTDYKERPALRTDKITPKGLTLTSIKDLKRLITKPKTTMVLDHAPQHDELMKLGSLNYEELKQFRWCFEDAMMRVITKRQQTSQQYTKDEIIAEIIDEYEASVDKYGHITEQKARVRVYCLSFLSGMAFVEFGVNDVRRKGKEVVRRQDIIPMRTEQWIRIEDYQFHCCVNIDEFNKSTVIRFQPPDGINVEILRFRVRPRKNFQLPLQVRAVMNVDKTNRDVEIRMEVLIPGYFSNSRKANQAPCENIAISFPIPEPWIYYFRVEHVWGYGSVHAHKARLGKVKGLDRITNMAEGLIPKGENPNKCAMEVNTGDCKYEHLLNGLVWRIPRLPERFQGAYKTHLMNVKIPLGPHDPIPESFEKFVTVDYVMPATAVSRAMIRSISSTSQADEPPDKWVKQLARFYYKVEIEYSYEVHSKGEAVPEKVQAIELPTSIVPGEKLTLSTQPSANPEAEAEGGEKPPKLAVSGDEDSSDEEAATKKKKEKPAAAAASPPSIQQQQQSEEPASRPTVLKVSDESDSDEDEEEERPKFKIQLNPVIQSFIDKGGAMVNGAMKKKQAEQQQQEQPQPPAHPVRPPPPAASSDTPKRPQSPGSTGGSDASDEELKEKGRSNPKRPPPPRPVAPSGGAAAAPAAAASGAKKWTVIAEADAPPKPES